MTKIKLDKVESPSERIISGSSSTLADHVIDRQGRVIKLREPTALDEFDLASALGSEAQNNTVLAMASQLIYVQSIDNNPFPAPKSYAQVRAAIQTLGKDGSRAVIAAVSEFAKAQSEEEENAEIKK